MKKFFSIVLTVVLFLTISAIPVFADETIIQNSDQDNVGSTIFIPESEINSGSQNVSPENSNSEISPMASGFGTILCTVSGDTAECPWTITVSGDLIKYSAVYVIYEKWENFKWNVVDSDRFEYGVTPPMATIRNVGFFTSEPGYYRARLSGSFTCVENGVYIPGGYDPSNFWIN
ncbi:hypothetical protein [Paenibacillus sp. NPDC093718]|uniref:hypothetical protein n=1 Tax=Paenibacillus sp. NPDC093718 TaxID=3390601 RepID=UPI003D027C19